MCFEGGCMNQKGKIGAKRRGEREVREGRGKKRKKPRKVCGAREVSIGRPVGIQRDETQEVSKTQTPRTTLA